MAEGELDAISTCTGRKRDMTTLEWGVKENRS